MRTDVLAHEATGPDESVSAAAPAGRADFELARAVGRPEGILSIYDRIPDARDALVEELQPLVGPCTSTLAPTEPPPGTAP